MDQQKKNTQLYCIALGYLAAYVYALQFAVHISKDENRKQFTKLNEIHEGCMIGCDGQNTQCQEQHQKKWWTSLTQYRGKNYYIGIDKTVNPSCFATFWSSSHFVLYFFLGYTAPDYFWTTFMIGALFECYEYQYYDCHDLLDIGFNTTGFLLGKLLRTRKT